MRRQRLKRIILVGAISISIALSSIGAFAINKSPIARLLIRDVVIATVAHHKAGEEILFEPEYIECMSSNPGFVENTYSNTLWALEYSQIIIPFFEREDIREIPVYPREIIIESKEVHREISITGLAYFKEKKISIFLNEEKKQADTRQVLPVLIHEHVHLQEGRFIGPWGSPWTVIIYEANTQAATIETLAAMCHSGDDLACVAFWQEIESYVSGTFWIHLQQVGLEKWYRPIAMLFWSGGINFQNVPTESICTYLQHPWDRIIVPGIMGEALDTGNFYSHEISDRNFVCKRLFMPFDDTEYLLGWLDQFIEWITPD